MLGFHMPFNEFKYIHHVIIDYLIISIIQSLPMKSLIINFIINETTFSGFYTLSCRPGLAVVNITFSVFINETYIN